MRSQAMLMLESIVIRKGYQWCTEPSVYISEKYYGFGIANALYTALFDILKMQGYVNAYAVITLPE
jgi:phosphinothricin acetyltransferase